MNSDEVLISYSVNGSHLGTAFTVNKSDLGEEPYLFPHILTKNVKLEVNYGQLEKPWFEVQLEEFKFPNEINEDAKLRGPKGPEKRADCEIIMMCGLPGAGKTYWVNNYVKEHAEKRYNVLGTNNLIDKMKVFFYLFYLFYYKLYFKKIKQLIFNFFLFKLFVSEEFKVCLNYIKRFENYY